MEVMHPHRLGQPLGRHQTCQPARQRLVVAQHQNGLVDETRQMLGAVKQDQRLARAGDAVDHPVPLAQAPRQLLLLQVHDPHEVGRRRRLGKELALRRRNAHLGEERPAQAVDLRRGKRRLEAHREHRPQALLEGLGLDVLEHLVLADHPRLRDHLTQPALLELPAREVGENDAIAPRKAELARLAPAGENELRVALQNLHGGLGILPRLFERVLDRHLAARRDQGKALPIGRADRALLPVLDLEDQEPAARMKNDEIRMPHRRPERHVVPAEVIVFELLDQPLRQPPLIAAVEGATAEGGDKEGHLVLKHCTRSLLLLLKYRSYPSAGGVP